MLDEQVAYSPSSQVLTLGGAGFLSRLFGTGVHRVRLTDRA